MTQKTPKPLGAVKEKEMSRSPSGQVVKLPDINAPATTTNQMDQSFGTKVPREDQATTRSMPLKQLSITAPSRRSSRRMSLASLDPIEVDIFQI